MDIAAAQWAEWWRELLQGGGFWPRDKPPSDLAKVQDDPDIQRLFYWDHRFSAPGFDGLLATPELRYLVIGHFDRARVWSETRYREFSAITGARQRGMVEGKVVWKVEEAIGHKARPFALDIRVLPVAGFHGWRLASGRALVSLQLYKHRDAFGRWLLPIVAELAR